MCTYKIGIVLIVVVCHANKAIGDVIIETRSGKVAGLEVKSIIDNEKYFSFLSIPYAEPPIGKLRFKPPVPHLGWKGIYEAKKERKHCAQYNMPQRKIKRYGFCGDEDCLHLSIHTPKKSNIAEFKLPVIVFLYNEHFGVSYNATKEYGPDFFMKEDVILVTVNHRLGFLGFAAFEDKILPGNNGIRDVILALKWLKNNINYFGGDPSEVTLIGNNGGAVLADILLQSPKAEGLFSRAILQSGSSWHPSYLDTTPKKRAKALANILSVDASTSELLIDSLSNISALQITDAELALIHPDESRATQRDIIQFGPVIEIEHDDAILTKLPEDDSIKLSVPVMIGFNSREAIEINERYLHNPDYLSIAGRYFVMTFPRRVKYHFNINNNVYFQAIKEVRELYFTEGFIQPSKPGEYMNYVGDVASFYPIDYTVRQYTNISSRPIFYYMFNYSGKLNFRKIVSLNHAATIDETWGASVGDELCYLFVCKKWRKIYEQLLEKKDSEEIKILQTMIKFITNFAKTGNPTPLGNEFIWTPASKEHRDCLIIDTKIELKFNIYEDKVKFWDDFIEKYGKLAVDGVVQDNSKVEL